MQDINQMLDLYFIAGTQDIVPGQSLPEVLQEALAAGITCFQYREKGAGSLTSPNERLVMAQACQKLCWEYEVPFIVNDDVALAREIHADGVHVGQEDESAAKLESLLSKEMILGLSCSDEKEVLDANKLHRVDYIGVGPVYGTISKPDAVQPIGTTKLAELTALSVHPVVAIGGISVANVRAVRDAGPAGISVISAITRSQSIVNAVSELKG